jgi:DNA (cytosine-5)-methyltransferase 1
LLSVAPGFIVRQNDMNYGRPERRSLSLDMALKTVVTEDTHALIGHPAFIAELHGTSKAAGIDEPLLCLTAGGNHHALLSTDAFLTYYYNNRQASGMGDPIHTVTSVDRAGLVGALESLTVEDLTFRMLAPHEIGAAMAFPGDYIVLGTNRDKVKQFGQAVTPPAMEMILEPCIATLR